MKTLITDQTARLSIFYIPIVFCAKYIDRTTEKAILRITAGERANISIPFARQRKSKSFDSCASFMTAIVAANFDWSIESCDKAPHDLNYERNTEKYGRAMKLTILLA